MLPFILQAVWEPDKQIKALAGQDLQAAAAGASLQASPRWRQHCERAS